MANEMLAQKYQLLLNFDTTLTVKMVADLGPVGTCIDVVLDLASTERFFANFSETYFPEALC